MTEIWKRTPMLRLLLPFACGIFIELSGTIHVAFIFFCILLIVFIECYRRIKGKRRSYANRYIIGIIFSISFLLVGILIARNDDPGLKKDFYRHHTNANCRFIIRLNDVPTVKEKTLKVVASVVAIVTKDSIISSSGNVLLYIAKDSVSSRLQLEDELVVEANVADIPEIRNPFEFDYRSYLNHHHVYGQIYAGKEQWKWYSSAEHVSFLGWFIQIREKLLNILKQYPMDQREYAVLSALVLGKTTEIDRELLNAYSASGAVHVLAVSGLHVALIYVVLAPILKRIFPRKKGKWLKTFVPVLLLWIYAGITGFSPSVLRAALMFSCFIIAENFQKENNAFNTMSASAFILFCFNPHIIFEVGFQLSYLAVLGIVVLNKPILNLFYTKNKITMWMWNLTAVSIAAQVSTLPLTLYYFHQFPTYFLMTNLVVIPLSTVVLYTSLAFFALCWITPIASFLAGLSAFLTRLMNDSMTLMETLPVNKIDGIDLSILHFFLVSGIVLFFCRWIFWQKSKALVIAILCVSGLGFVEIGEDISQNNQSEICCYSLHNHDCISWANGKNLIVVADSLLHENPSDLFFHTKSYWNHLGFNSPNFLFDCDSDFHQGNDFGMKKGCLFFGNVRLCFIEKENARYVNQIPAETFVFGEATKGVYFSSEMLSCFSDKDIILSASLSKSKKSFLKNALPSSCRIHDLMDGAIILQEGQWRSFKERYH